MRTRRSGTGESGGSASGLLAPPALEATRDAPSHKLHVSSGTRRRLSRGADLRWRVKAALRFGRTSASHPVSSGKDENRLIAW